MQRQDATVQAVVRKELRKKTDWRYTDVSSAAASVSSTGTITSLLGNLVRGDAGLDNFQGNEIKPQALLFQYYLTTQQTYNSMRVMIIQWFDAGTPVLSGILQNTTTSIATISPTLVTNKRYIKVLYDKTHILAPTAGGDATVLGYGTAEPVKVYIPGKRLRAVKYNSSNNTVQDGNLYVIAVSDDSVPSYPGIWWYSRVTFSDGA